MTVLSFNNTVYAQKANLFGRGAISTYRFTYYPIEIGVGLQKNTASPFGSFSYFAASVNVNFIESNDEMHVFPSVKVVQSFSFLAVGGKLGYLDSKVLFSPNVGMSLGLKTLLTFGYNFQGLSTREKYTGLTITVAHRFWSDE